MALLGRATVQKWGIPHPPNDGVVNTIDYLGPGLVHTSSDPALQCPHSWASAWQLSTSVGLRLSSCSPLWDVTLSPLLSHGAPGHHWLWGL